MEENKPHKITVEDSEGRVLTATLTWDANAEEWAQTFRSILYWLTFHPETIGEYIPDPTDDPKAVEGGN